MPGASGAMVERLGAITDKLRSATRLFKWLVFVHGGRDGVTVTVGECYQRRFCCFYNCVCGLREF